MEHRVPALVHPPRHRQLRHRHLLMVTMEIIHKVMVAMAVMELVPALHRVLTVVHTVLVLTVLQELLVPMVMMGAMAVIMIRVTTAVSPGTEVKDSREQLLPHSLRLAHHSRLQQRVISHRLDMDHSLRMGHSQLMDLSRVSQLMDLSRVSQLMDLSRVMIRSQRVHRLLVQV